MPDESQFALLLETVDPVELATVKSLLDSAEILYVVQGDHHHHLSGGLFGNPSIAPRVLVNREHLERAKELLAARPTTDLAEAVCAVHEKPATMKCSRCDSSLCAECKVTGQPPLCESCAAGEFELHAAGVQKGRTARKVVAALMLAPLTVAFVVLVIQRILSLFSV